MPYPGTKHPCHGSVHCRGVGTPGIPRGGGALLACRCDANSPKQPTTVPIRCVEKTFQYTWARITCSPVAAAPGHRDTIGRCICSARARWVMDAGYLPASLHACQGLPGLFTACSAPAVPDLYIPGRIQFMSPLADAWTTKLNTACLSVCDSAACLAPFPTLGKSLVSARCKTRQGSKDWRGYQVFLPKFVQGGAASFSFILGFSV